jgi:hypothetical protein
MNEPHSCFQIHNRARRRITEICLPVLCRWEPAEMEAEEYRRRWPAVSGTRPIRSRPYGQSSDDGFGWMMDFAERAERRTPIVQQQQQAQPKKKQPT